MMFLSEKQLNNLNKKALVIIASYHRKKWLEKDTKLDRWSACYLQAKFSQFALHLHYTN